MEKFFIEGFFIPKSAIKRTRKPEIDENAIEPFSRLFWARDAAEALRLAEQALEGGQWVGLPKVNRTGEEQRMRESKAPELPGFDSIAPKKRK